MQDINFKARRVYLRKTKGDKPRSVPMGRWAEEGLRELVKVADTWPGADGERILPIMPNTFSNWVHQAAVDAGFPPGRKRRGHTLRATAITQMLNEGEPVHVVARVAGHASIATTTAYAAVVDPQKRKATSRLGGPPTPLEEE